MKNYRSITRDLLEQSGYEVTFSNNGTPSVISHKAREPHTMSFIGICGPQKYSTNNREYLYVYLSLRGRKCSAYALHRVVWAWCKGECPVDLTIDHKNNEHSTAFDNRMDNLRELTHAENLSSKRLPRNQWSWMLTDEQMEEFIALKEKAAGLSNQLASCRKEQRDWKAMAARVREAIASIKDDPGMFLSSEIDWSDSCPIWIDEGGYHGYRLWDSIHGVVESWAQNAVLNDDLGTEYPLVNLRAYLGDINVVSMTFRTNARHIAGELSRARHEMETYVRDIREEYNNRKKGN